MKKHLLLLCLCLFAGMNIFANEVSIDGIYYRLSGNEAEAYGAESDISELIIPESVSYNGNTYNVTSIPEGAFMDFPNLTSVTIGNNVTSIGQYSFFYCENLNTLTLGRSLTSIAGAFLRCPNITTLTIDCENLTNEIIRGLPVRESLQTLIVGDNVTSIPEEAFIDFPNLTSVTIGNNVTSIGQNSFFYCVNLNTLTLGRSLTSIAGAFRQCPNITTLTIDCENLTYDILYELPCGESLQTLIFGDNVTSIPEGAFRYSNLTSVTFGHNVTSIGRGAFYYCENLKEIYCLAEEVPEVASDTFEGVDVSTVTLIVPDDAYDAYKAHPVWGQFFTGESTDITYTSVEGVVITFSVLSEEDKTLQVGLGHYRKPAIRSNTTGTVTIPATVGDYTVTAIGVCAFSDCNNLNSVNIPESVTVIDDLAFWYCYSLTSIDIPESVKRIGSQAFDQSGLTSIFIPKTVEILGEDNPFAGCWNLNSIEVEEGNANYDSRNNCNAVIETATNKLVGGCQNTIIPESVTSLGNLAFYFCYGLTSIAIPESVTTLEPYSFCGCTDLSEINIPSSVTYIGRMSFYNCLGLTSIVIPDGVTSIYDYTFEYCYNLETVTLGRNMAYIDRFAFMDCTALKEIYCLAEEVPEVESDAFEGVDVSKVMLVVPDDSYNAYKAHPIWSQFMIETPTAINLTPAFTQGEEDVYDLSGRKTDKPQKGINIIRYSDGSSKKALIK